MIKRLLHYLSTTYNPLLTLPASVLSFYGLYFSARLLFGAGGPAVTLASALGMLSLFFFLLFLRLSDEIKDYDTDKVLFPQRPVPSGKVRLRDVRILWWIALGLLVLLNATPLNFNPFFAVILLYALLMYFYFFLRNVISRSLILALLTHNPVMYLFQIYVILLLGREYPLNVMFPEAFLLSVLFYLPGLVWEMGRKIRAREEETEYETYSKVFGRPLACLFPVLGAGLMLALLIYYSGPLGLSAWLIVAACVVFAGLVLTAALFLARVLKKGAWLKQAVQVYILAFNAGLLADLLIRHGIRLD
jgi:4-hydroxybenzoate polyprenyltransferase